MCSAGELAIRAAKESKDVSVFVEAILSHIRKTPTGIDLFFPVELLHEVERVCDEQNIPFYRLDSTTASVAATYSLLSSRELSR